MMTPEPSAAWTATFLTPPGTRYGDIARSTCASFALAATFGIAIGARYGVLSMAIHAVGVPLGLAAVAVLGGPAFFVGCAHSAVKLAPRDLLRAIVGGLATSGLVLAGTAPAALLVSMSAETPIGAALVSAAGLALGGLLGLRRLMAELDGALRLAGFGARMAAWAFGLFAVVLATRVWWLTLPCLGRPLLGGGA
jgi:hypothetical protein